jgi:hypothetical protein
VNYELDIEFYLHGTAERHLIVEGWFIDDSKQDGYKNEILRTVGMTSLPKGATLRMRLVDSDFAKSCKWDDSKSRLELPNGLEIRVESTSLDQKLIWVGDGTLGIKGNSIGSFVALRYVNTLPSADRFLTDFPLDQVLAPSEVLIGPGFTAHRLALPETIMPTALGWTVSGKLVFATLKGQLVAAIESDSSQKMDWRVVEDGFASPYGLLTRGKSVELLTKTGLYRVDSHLLEEELFTKESRFWGSSARRELLADGWGMTDDYHDWAVGLISGEGGSCYVALPCQQDVRSEAAASYRGRILRLMPSGSESPGKPFGRRRFNIETISSGHRFPMGMARNRDGELFVTDNQGNYNPFNELNHVRKGAHFGFINALEKQNGYQPPPLTPPAINIPHPWTRSVNGICFLDTPDALAGVKPGSGAEGAVLLPAKSIYGPLEGHLIGCEYDTRRLIRMSLQKIGDTYQGCAYPLSIPPDDVEKGLLGPIVCAIKPTTGELYVGEIRDSGWGASNNIGQITKIKIEPEKLPCGIAEVRATSTGFTIDFFKPVDPANALDTASYAIESYRRESTPAYGGPDLDRRSETERIKSITLSPDKKQVALSFSELRTGGYVYEFKLKNLTPGSGMFHPDEAHYTLHRLPQ